MDSDLSESAFEPDYSETSSMRQSPAGSHMQSYQSPAESPMQFNQSPAGSPMQFNWSPAGIPGRIYSTL